MMVSLWTDFESAGGTRLGTLNPVSGAAITRIDGDDRLNMYVSRAEWLNTPSADIRRVIRIDWPEGTVDEYRIQRVKGNDYAATVQLEAIPVFAELVTSGVVLTNTNGVATSRIAGSYKVSQWCSLFALAHQGATRINLVIGTVASDAIVDTEYDGATPGQIIRDIASKTGQEVEIVRTSSTTWTLNFKLLVGSSASTLVMRSGVNVFDLEQSVDDVDLATTVIPLGDPDEGTGSRATIANVKYRIQFISGTGPVWIGLYDSSSSRGAIQTDTQWVGMSVVWPNGALSTILDSKASDSSVQVSSQPGVSVGNFVGLAANSTTPITEVFDSTSQSARGRRAVALKLSGQRGERNDLANGRFASGLTSWSDQNTVSPPAYAEVQRTELGLTVTGAANGARAANTGTGTPLALKNLPANSWVRQQDQIKIGGTTYTISSDTIASTTGTLALPISPSLSGSYADNTAITLERRAILSLTLTTAVSPLDSYLFFDANNANDYLTFSSGLINTSLSNATYATSAGLSAFSYLGTGNYSGALRLFLGTAVGATGLNTIPFNWATKSTDVFTITTTSFTYTDSNNGTLNYSATTGTIQVGLRVRFFQGSGYCIGRVTAYTSSTLTLAREGYYPFASVSSGVLNSRTTYASMAMITAGTVFTLNALRESRTLNLNGAHNTGATTLNTKAVTNISTRNWVNGDTLRFESPIVATVVITAALYEGQDIDVPAQTYYRLTYNASTSTNLELFNGTSDLIDALSFPSAGVYCTISSIDKVNKYLYIYYFNDIPGQGVAVATGSTTITMRNTYTVNAGASWASTGLVTLSFSSGIDTTRYAISRGMKVYSNFYANAPQLYVETTSVTNGATSIILRGETASDTVQPGYPVTGVLYRVLATASKIPFTGNTLYAASSAQANGSGVVNVTITAANTNAIADGEVATIVRPSVLRSSDPNTGSVVRMLYAVGANNIPSAGSYGIRSESVSFTVPSGQTRTVTAFVTFALTTGTYALGSQPAIALINSANSTILGYARTSDANVQVVGTVTWVRLVCQVVLNADTTLHLACYGGASAPVGLWTTVIDAMLALTSSTDVPYIDDSWANLLAMRGIDYHANRRIPVPNIRCEWAELRSWCDASPTTPSVVMGQTVTYPSLGITRRVVQIERSIVLPDKITVEVGTVPTELSRRVANLLANS